MSATATLSKLVADGKLQRVELPGGLAETADRVGLTRELSRALAGLRERRGRHDPGRVIRDLAVMLADGGDCLSDLRAVRDQAPLFGPVASDTTAGALACDRAP